MHSEATMYCRVCGYEDITPPWGEDGRTPLFEYCPCCGVEHGYQDSLPVSAKKYRAEWIKNGACWDDKSTKPMDWNLEQQLSQVPEEFQ